MLILLLILKIHRIGRDVLLNEKVQRISETEFVIEKEKYEPIILIFNEADNKEVENSILENLLISYENRLGKEVASSVW